MGQTKRVLLVVEDDDDVREAIVDTLEDIGAKILTARNGVEALEVIRNHPPTAILSDINMPQMNGIELLRSVREQNSETPFIILTAFGDKSNVLEALKLGAFDFVDKPFLLESLIQIIKDALEFGEKIEDYQAKESSFVQSNGGDKKKEWKTLFEERQKSLFSRFHRGS